MNNGDCDKLQTDMISALQKELPRLRKSTKVSQSKLGKKIGLSRQFISEIERGEAQLSWATYIAAVKFFSVNGKPDILPYIDEHVEFVGRYMEIPNDNEAGIQNED